MAVASPENPEKSGADPISTIQELQRSGFGNMMGASKAWAEVFGEMSAEFLGFLSDRFKEDVKTQHQILNCKDFGELQKIQAEFVQTAINQYQTETGKLMKMGSIVFSDSVGSSDES